MNDKLQDKLKKYSSSHLIVGLTGHMDLIDGDRVGKHICEKFDELRQATGKPIALISGTAVGADELGVKALIQKDKFIQITDKKTPNKRHPELDSQVGIEYIDLSKSKHSYRVQAEIIVTHARHLIAIWDGVDTGKTGGTSEVVQMWHSGKSFDGTVIELPKFDRRLHQLITPRTSNPFPVHRPILFRSNGERILPTLPPRKNYTWSESRISAQSQFTKMKIRAWIWKYAAWALACLLIIVVVTYILLGESSCVVCHPCFVAILLALGWITWLYHYYKDSRTLLFRFVYPMVLAVLTLTIGTMGFYYGDKPDFLDAFFSAANLITLNSSAESSEKLTSVIDIARLTGGILAGYAFILAFSLAAGRERMNRLKFWLYRRGKKKPFDVVIGDGAIAAQLAMDLAAEEENRVVLLSRDPSGKTDTIIQNSNIWLLKGNLTYSIDLKQTHFDKARYVYVVSTNDEENFRITQELDIINSTIHQNDNKSNWYVLLRDQQQRRLLQEITHKDLHLFDINAMIARRLLRVHPVDRFDHQISPARVARKSARVIIIGFSAMARAILDRLVIMGHFGPEHQLKIRIYYSLDEKVTIAQYQEQNSYLASSNPVSWKIKWVPIPESINGMTYTSWSLYRWIDPAVCTTIYFCKTDTLESTTTASQILPRLGWLHKGVETKNQPCDLQVYCHYEFPDRDDLQHMEKKMNAMAPHVPFFFFGSLMRECSAFMIREEERDYAAKVLALLYGYLDKDKKLLEKYPLSEETKNQLSLVPDTGKSDRDQEWEKAIIYARHILGAKSAALDFVWKELSEADRSSNRESMEHGWVKMRLMNLDVYQLEEIVNDILSAINPETIKQLGAIEHIRWNAEKLKLGWNIYKNEERWKESKEELKKQKQHFYLTKSIPSKEQYKDETQIIALPFLISYLLKK